MAATFKGDEKPNITNPIFGPGRIPGFQSDNSVMFARSDDAGSTWSTPIALDPNLYDGQDEVPFDVIPDMDVDVFPTVDGEENEHYGNIYVTWNRAYPPDLVPGFPGAGGGIEVRIAISRDGGGTWEIEDREERAKIIVDVLDPPLTGNKPGEGFIDQAHIAVGPGAIYISHFAGGNTGVNISRDGGASFQAPDFARPCPEGGRVGCQIVFGTSFRTQIQKQLPNNEFRTTLQRLIAADPVRPGNAYAIDPVAVFNEFGDEIDPADLFFGQSTDFGRTWDPVDFNVASNPGDLSSLECEGATGSDCVKKTPLNDDNGSLTADLTTDTPVVSHQAISKITTDAEGNIGVIWYDTRRDPNNVKLDVFGAISKDGGDQFTHNFRISDRSFDAHDGVFTNANGEDEFYIGDFLGLDMANGRALASWVDTRAGNQDIFFADLGIDDVPAATNDRFEPNDTPERSNSPTVVGPVIQRTLSKLAVEKDDIDWFLVETSAKGALEASTSYEIPNPSGVTLELWDANGSTRLATSVEVRDEANNLIGHSISRSALTGEEYLIRVSGSADEKIAYSLSMQSVTEDLGPQVHKIVGLSLEDGERALYLLDAAATGSLDIAFSAQADVLGDLTLSVLDADTQTQLETTGPVTASNSITLSSSVRQTQQLLLRVDGESGDLGSFQIEITNRDLLIASDSDSFFFPVAGVATQATLGDINNDGNLDAFVTSSRNDVVNILLGNGDGTLQAPSQEAIGAFVLPQTDVTKQLPFGREVVAADFDDDGKLDLAVNNHASADVSILLGKGDGTAFPQRRFEATPLPFDITYGDVNNDDKLDIVVAEADIGSRADGMLATLIGIGDGRFRPQIISHYPVVGNNQGTIELADIDEDGNLDVVLSGDGVDAEFTILLGDGAGNFVYVDAATSDHPAARLASALAVGDINEDGHIDVATFGYESGEGRVSLGNGDGTFLAPLNLANGQAPLSATIADFGSEIDDGNGGTALGPADGRADILVAFSGAFSGNSDSPLTAAEIAVYPTVFDDDGNFVRIGERQSLDVRVGLPRDVDVGDFNGDETPDVLVVQQGGVLVIFGDPPEFEQNSSADKARNYGVVVHQFDQTQTIVPDRQEAFYKFTVPVESQTDQDQVVDVSLNFEHFEDTTLNAELRDANDNLVGSGERFRILARQGAEFTLRVFGEDNAKGAFTPIINVLPQVISVESQTLLPGDGETTGGPTNSVVLRLQGDRLDPETAMDPANYSLVSLGPDRIFGTADDEVAEIDSAVYSPGTNTEVSSGRTYPTSVSQTVTLTTKTPLEDGSYRVEVKEGVQSASVAAGELEKLADTDQIVGHPVMSFRDGQISQGSTSFVSDLVLPQADVGDISIFNDGTAFLTQLHADMAAFLDTSLTRDSEQVTEDLTELMRQRLLQTLGPAGARQASVFAIWLDPVDVEVAHDDGDVSFELEDDMVEDNNDQCFVEVGGIMEIIVCAYVNASDEVFNVTVGSVTEASRGGVVEITNDADEVTNLTEKMQDEDEPETEFEFTLE